MLQREWLSTRKVNATLNSKRRFVVFAPVLDIVANMKLLVGVLLSLIPLILSSDVLEFHDSDFATQIAEHDVVLVEFFAPW